MRGFLGEITAASGERDVIVDMEAGLEHLSRGTGRHLTRFLATVEPYYRSMETARRVGELARELGITEVLAVGNKLRDDRDRDAVRRFCAAHGLPIVAEVPYDQTLIEAERAGRAPLDYDPNGAAVQAIAGLARALG